MSGNRIWTIRVVKCSLNLTNVGNLHTPAELTLLVRFLPLPDIELVPLLTHERRNVAGSIPDEVIGF
jgi:hypothetical protein